MSANKKKGLLDMLFGDDSVAQKGGSRSRKRNTWIDEVRAVQAETGLDWKNSLKEASRRRKINISRPLTQKEAIKQLRDHYRKRGN